MKTLSQIYDSLKSSFLNKTKLDIEPGTVIDSYMLASSEGLVAAYQEIENNKNPYIFTKLAGIDLDSTGYFVNCARLPNESDESYKFRLINWVKNNESSNITAIQNALINMQYASFVTYVPYTNGVGTATAYIIPTLYTDTVIANAISETQQRLKKVVSPASYIEYVIPEIVLVDIAIYVQAKNTTDTSLVKSNISKKVSEYVNAIPVGSYLSLGEINKIGVNEPNVEFFNIVQLYLNGNPINSLTILQKVESKFLFDKITWWTAVV